MSSYEEFLSNEIMLNKSDLKEFDKKYWLDDFYFNHVEVKYKEELLSILKIILVLSQGQIAVKWGLTFNKSFIRVNMKEE